MGRALLVQGKIQLRSGFSEYLANRGIEVYTAKGADEALALLSSARPDVTALDIDNGDENGIDLIVQVRNAGSLCLVVSEHGDAQDRVRALSLGADDYVVKPVQLEELFLRVRNMLAHRQPNPIKPQNTILDLNGVRVDLLSRAVLAPDGRPAAVLTATELAMLRILAADADHIVSKEMLLGETRGEQPPSATRSLDVGISRLRIKLRSARAPVEVRSVRQVGYILSRSPHVGGARVED